MSVYAKHGDFSEFSRLVKVWGSGTVQYKQQSLRLLASGHVGGMPHQIAGGMPHQIALVQSVHRCDFYCHFTNEEIKARGVKLFAHVTDY